MPEVKNLYTIIARDVTTDASDNMNSLIKIIDKFTFGINKEEFDKNAANLKGQPIGFPANYSVATSWIFGAKLKKDTLLNFKISIVDPKGKQLEGGPEQENQLPTGIDKVNMNFNVQGMPVTIAGKYKILAEVFSKDGVLLARGEYPFEVELSDAPAAPAA